MDKIGEWQIEKYAHTTVRATHKEKEWETLEKSPSCPIVLTVTKVGLFQFLPAQVYFSLMKIVIIMHPL